MAAASVEEHLAGLPEDVAARVQELRRVVHEVVPGVGETISYAIPTFTLDGAPLVHVGAWKHDIGIYPLPALDEAGEAELAPWRATGDTMRLPHAQPLPRALVARVVQALRDGRR